MRLEFLTDLVALALKRFGMREIVFASAATAGISDERSQVELVRKALSPLLSATVEGRCWASISSTSAAHSSRERKSRTMNRSSRDDGKR